MKSKHVVAEAGPLAGALAAVVAVMLGSAGLAYAQEIGDRVVSQSRESSSRSSENVFGILREGHSHVASVGLERSVAAQTLYISRVSIQQALASVAQNPVVAANGAQPRASQALSSRTQSSTLRQKVFIGAVIGLFTGGYLGAHIEGNRCGCDDPGLQGAIIGAPVGAVIGGIVAAKFF